jgi:hypothetical protein
MFKDKELLKLNGCIYRVLASSDDGMIFIINCTNISAPRFMREDELAGAVVVSESDMQSANNRHIPEHLNALQEQACNRRFARIAPALIYLTDERKRYSVIAESAESLHLSRRRLKDDLNLYLVYQTKAIFAPPLRVRSNLSEDQRNMRWALNKYYYTRFGRSIPQTYVMMLKERYCDTTGSLLPHHPSIHQFQYYFRKTRKLQTEYITREGIKAYQMTRRPLLGAGVQQFAPVVGMGMLDSTVCDIYLRDDAGSVVGRPLLTVCVDAHTSMCTAYSLTWAGGLYSIRNMLLNAVTNKMEMCKQLGIDIHESDWDCNTLMATYITDKGSEFASANFEQLSELGVTVVNLPAFRAELKGPVEKLFSLIQDAYKPYLKGHGIIETDFRRRGGHDYRLDATLTLDEFEKVVIRAILYYNTQRVLANFPYTREMLAKRVPPHAASVWNYAKSLSADGLIKVDKKRLMLVLLPRTKGKFSRKGLVVNGLRYHHDGYIEHYLRGDDAIVAYNPDNTSSVYLVTDDYCEFSLIEARFADMSFDEKDRFVKDIQCFVGGFRAEALQSKIDLANHIETIVANAGHGAASNIKHIRETREMARIDTHKDFIKEASNG